MALACTVGVVGAALLIALPTDREPVLFGLYAVLSHVLISPFPIEPPLLYYAKTYPSSVVAGLALLGCFTSGFFDYQLLILLLNHRSIRPKFENTRLFQSALAFFHTSPFLMLVVVHFTPIPFYPFKFLSIAGGYPFWKYQLAALIARAPRYYLLAWLGYVVQPPNWSLIALVALLVLVGLTRYLRGRNALADA